MDRFRDFQIEQISFWAGFIAATLIWWIISAVRKNWSRIKSWIKSQYDAYLERRLAGAELFLRESTYKRSQESHLAAPLFPLDDLAIEPLILVPPTKILLEETPSEDTIIQKIIPYIPDYPDLLSHIGYPSMSLSNTLANPINLFSSAIRVQVNLLPLQILPQNLPGGQPEILLLNILSHYIVIFTTFIWKTWILHHRKLLFSRQ